MVNLMSKDQYIIYPTTNSGYGVGEKDKFCDETSDLNPLSLYGKTKVQAEKIILEKKKEFSNTKPSMATRQCSSSTIESISKILPQLIGGSADLSGSNNTKTSNSIVINKT